MALHDNPERTRTKISSLFCSLSPSSAIKFMLSPKHPPNTLHNTSQSHQNRESREGKRGTTSSSFGGRREIGREEGVGRRRRRRDSGLGRILPDCSERKRSRGRHGVIVPFFNCTYSKLSIHLNLTQLIFLFQQLRSCLETYIFKWPITTIS